METAAQKNQRIAKNTVLLYIRTAFTMLVSLYTSRIILKVLGVDDYGIYNVVGGTIAMFSIFSGSLSGAISRFITFGLGEGNLEKLKNIFATSVSIQIGLSILIFLLSEIIGIWLVNAKLNIPADRLYAAHWVLQFSIFTFIVGLISVPYNACIIAHEHMKVFAYIGILEVVLKLLFVAALFFSPFDKLIVYSALLALISLILRIIYGVYCKRHFEECCGRLRLDRSLLKEMTGYAGWNFFGNTAYLFNTQGVNILINLFFGVALNAARGIVTQVEGAVMQFVNNFMTAITPQITKSYAANDLKYMQTLVCRGAKFSFFLLMFFLIPIEFEADLILQIWLGNVPEYAPLFLRLSLIGSAMLLLGNTSLTAIMATGQIRNYQLCVTIIGCLVFPFTWVAYKLGGAAFITYVIYIVIYALLIWIRLIFMHKLLGFSINIFIKKVLYPIVLVSIFSLILPLILYTNMNQSFIRLIAILIGGTLTTAAGIYILGLDYNEREKLKTKIRHLMSLPKSSY